MRQEGGTTRTPRPEDAGDGLVQPLACQGSRTWWDDAGSLATAMGAWGWLVGIRAGWLTEPPWEGARSRGAAVLCLHWGQGNQPSPSSSHEETACEKQEVKPSLSSRDFGRVRLPRPLWPVSWQHAHTQAFTLPAIRRLLGPLFLLGRKQSISH